MKLKLLITIGLLQSLTLFASEVESKFPSSAAIQSKKNLSDLEDRVLSSIQNNDASIRYVDANYKGLQKDGKSWFTPYTSLSKALKESWRDPSIVFIFIAEGTYYPNLKPFNNGIEMKTSDNRDKTFHVRPDLVIYGGYSKSNIPGTNPPKRSWDPKKYPTILSGDLGIKNRNNDNAYHVILNTKLSNSSTFEATYFWGITVKSGHSIGVESTTINVNNEEIVRNYGAGMYSTGTHLSVRQSIFENNSSGSIAGAIFLNYNVGLRIDNSTFQNNYSDELGGAIFAANMFNAEDFSKGYIFEKNNFVNNSAAMYAGAIYLYESRRIEIYDNELVSNRARVGGALYLDSTQCSIVNNMIRKNKATVDAGAICCQIANSTSPAGHWLVMWRNKIYANSCTHPSYGTGGVFIIGVPPKITGDIYLSSNIFRANAGYTAGALSMWSPGNVYNNTFYNNSADDISKGAGAFLTFNEIIDNSILSVNNLFNNNKVDSYTNKLGSDVRHVGVVTASHNLYQNSLETGFYPGSAFCVYGVDPKIFKNDSLNSLELSLSSPAIDKGKDFINSFHDQYDNPSNGTRDIGAHEFYKK